MQLYHRELQVNESLIIALQNIVFKCMLPFCSGPNSTETTYFPAGKYIENVPFCDTITFPPAEDELLGNTDVNFTLISTFGGKLSCSTRPERRYRAGDRGGITLLNELQLFIINLSPGKFL